MPADCKKAVSFLAEETGRIAALTQQQILTGDPDWALKRVKEKKYDTSKGHSPRYIRVRTTPPRQVAYQPMMPSGNKSYTVTNPQTGAATTVTGDKQGRGCSLPAETIQYGYDVRQRCLMGKALEAGPWCIMDLLEKEAFGPLISQIRKDLPRYAKEDFGRQLLRDVETFSYYKFSIADGFPFNVNQSYFPCVPKGGPSIGFFRKIETLLKAQGWDKGSETPMIGGRPAIQIRMSREAIEWAIEQRKKELDLRLESKLYVDDGIWGKTVTYEGIQFIEAALPTRGYLRETGTGTYEFVEVPPYDITVAGGEGFWTIPNDDYYQSEITVNGATYRMCEIAHIIHPTAMERQSLGSIPSVAGKSFNRNFDFEVELIPDWELADRGCNKDLFFFAFRLLHAYAPLPMNPELMTAIIFLAPSNRYTTTDPWKVEVPAASEPVSLAALTSPQATNCDPCDQPTEAVRQVPDPTCSDLFPENGVGVMRFQSISYSVDESAGNLTLVVERVGGSVGAASLVMTITGGTAIAPTNFTAPSGFAGANPGPFTKTISWTDAEFGPKTVVVPIVNAGGDDDGKQFTAGLGTATGATLGAAVTATVTILDAEGA